ncbi:gag-pol polyprotein [Cucumis melo var. makuwa]|uniref:Gag-pol polyprotein n=1 Tax=Cucumis melo var. makuwa TaxID=1194695 RepID=A0A5D3BVP0_CUCMM|nr:gag-pol polyprotein [Cucumis melo var. makuwa]TYK03793.1 gag-pol polyprotein [Cucumis melo var. makuwa]
MKVTTIEEGNDLSTMKLDELFGSLRTFELYLGEGTSRKKTGLALTSVKEESTEEHKVSLNNDSLAESVVLLTKQVKKLKKDYNPSKFEKNGNGIRCHECEGFGHIQIECAIYLKHKKKSLVATFSDEEDFSESDVEEVGIVLISITNENKEEAENVNAQTIDQQESMLDDSFDESTLKRKWKEDQAIIIHQQERIQCLMEENQSFLSSIVTLKTELKEAKNQFEELTKYVKMLTNGTKKLDDLIGQGKRYDDKRGLSFSEKGITGNEVKTIFVRERSTQNNEAENGKVKFPKNVVPPVRFQFRRKRRVCHFCGKDGHIRPYYFQLQSLMFHEHAMSQNTYINTCRTKWRPKTILENCKVALTSVNDPKSTYWYFDSGCSRHMMGNAAFFLKLSECNAGSVVFDDGGKGRIISKGTIDHPGLPFLRDVRLVQGLSANLINISQLCGQGYHVSFSKDRCNVVDNQNKIFLSGTRSSDNCYHWDSNV